jgi:pimeloyl-ACP methyl ester carboxylesterase
MGTQSVIHKFFRFPSALGMVLLLSITSFTDPHAQTTKVKNIVLVHGAFADGSGWKGVYDILTKKGYNVTAVQNPLSSLEDDVATTNLALDRQDGPVILVGHSWGGEVITQAGVHSKVVGLVYVAAFQPDLGESAFTWISSMPPAPENGIAPDGKGYFYFSKEKYHAGFCGDLSQAQADFMYASQGSFAAKAFSTPVTQAAWKTKPTWGIVALGDRSILPAIEEKMYTRSSTRITKLNGSHCVFISHPEEVAKVIIEAAENAVKAGN